MRVLIPLPDRDFEPTEVARPWNAIRNEGWEVTFATESGASGVCDPLALHGAIGPFLAATKQARALYSEMIMTRGFKKPLKYADVDPAEYDAISLPGGHAPGMKQYLESKRLQEIVLAFFRAKKPIGSICHAGVVLARTIDPATGKSVIHGRRMTALTKLMERSAYVLTRWKLGNHFRTYPEYVQDEVVRAIGDRKLFLTGPIVPRESKPFTVVDGNLVTARWPGDAERFARQLVDITRALTLFGAGAARA